jgi:hypothetical protein
MLFDFFGSHVGVHHLAIAEPANALRATGNIGFVSHHDDRSITPKLSVFSLSRSISFTILIQKVALLLARIHPLKAKFELHRKLRC